METILFDVRKVYEKNSELKRDNVKTLIEWVGEQQHLPKINEQQAILFLQSCYCKMDAAKAAIEKYFTTKTKYKYMFFGRNPLDSPLCESLNIVLHTFLPKKTPEGYSILFVKYMDSNPNNINFDAQMKYLDMICMEHYYQEGPSKGLVICFDMDGMVFGHLFKIKLMTMARFINYFLEGMPIRFKAFHMFNLLSFYDKLIGISKPFLKQEIIDRMYYHKTVEAMVPFIPRDCLPRDYGGLADSTKVLLEKRTAKTIRNKLLFEWEDQFLVDEDNREKPLSKSIFRIWRWT